MLFRLAHLSVRILTLPALLLWFAAGWRVEGKIPPINKFVILGVPHTTNWDYLHMLMLAFYWNRKPFVTIKDYWMKKPIIGTILRWAGGVSIDRSKSTHAVEQLSQQINAADHMMLVFTPEGTRAKTDYWKTGFYYTALGANVPIVLAYIDYERKRGGVGLTVHPTGDIEADFAIIRDFYSQHGRGKYPEQAGTIAVPPPKN